MFLPGVGRACLIALLDIRNQNPCSRILTSKYKTLDKVRQSVLEEIKCKREYRNQFTTGRKYKNYRGLNPEFPVQVPSIIINSRVSQNGHNSIRSHATACDNKIWRSYADGQVNRKSNDDNDSNRSYDEIVFSNNHDKSFDNYDNNNYNDNNNHSNHKNKYDEDVNKNDENKDEENRRKSQMKRSVRKKSPSTYDSTNAIKVVSSDSTRRKLLTPRMTAAALRASSALKCSRSIDIRHSSSSSWPGTRSTTIEVAGHIRAGSVGSPMNMSHHGIDVSTSSYTRNHPNTIPSNEVNKVKVFSIYNEAYPEIKLAQNGMIDNKTYEKNNKDSNKAVRKISFSKLELPNDAKISSAVLTPTTRKSKITLKISKKEIEKKLSIEKSIILSYNKSESEEVIDGDLNDLIRDSLKINLTTVQSPIFITCKPEKVVLNTENTVKKLHNICTNILKEKRLSLSERLLSENLSAHKTTLSKKSIISSNKILRNNPVKIVGNKIDAVITMRNKNLVEGQKISQNSIFGIAKNNQFKSCTRAKIKGSNIEDKIIQSSPVFLLPQSNQLFDESASGRKVIITKIQNDLSSSDGTHLKSVTEESHLNGILDKRTRRKSYSIIENLRTSSMIEREVRKKRNSVPQRS